MAEHGKGGLQSPPDERDLTISNETLKRVGGPVPLEDAFLLRLRPPITDQGMTPECVAFSSAYEKSHADHNDFGKFTNFDEHLFFRQIGGNQYGAVARAALQRMKDYGYPEDDATPSPQKHQIAGYARVEQTREAIKRAIQRAGGVNIVGPWWESWEFPTGDKATLPGPTGASSGHEWWAPGWDEVGVIGQQSWGGLWGNKGLFRMPWYYVVHFMWEVWTTVDIETLTLIARAKLASTGVYIRTTGVLGEAGKMEGTHFATAIDAGLQRKSDGQIIETPWDKPFRFKGFKAGAHHGIGKYPNGWAVLVINGHERCVARPLVRLLSVN